MKKIFTYLLILAAAFITTNVFCQTQTKFDFFLASKQMNYATGRLDGSELLPVFVKGNIPEIKKLVEASKGIFKYSYGSIAAIQIPLSALSSFMQSKSVIRMEGQPSHMRVLNDTMRVRNHMVEVQMGQTPLTQGYKGKGIVLGFIDSGIDFTHPDFEDTTNRTRVKFLWDQNQPIGVNTPLPYGYGQEWTQAELDTALSQNNTAALQTMDSSATLEFGHGSNVAGSGAGNGRSNGRNMGCDPDADIIMVAFNFNSNNPNLMTDAVNYIYTKANELGEPCVINASLGDYDGSHDGQDLQAQMIDSMITAQAGRCFVASAGNAGVTPYHVSFSNQPGDTSFTWFSYNGSYVDMQIFSDTANFRNVQFSIGADENTPVFSFRGSTSFSTIFPFLPANPPITDTLKNSNGQPLGAITYYAQLLGGVYSLEIVVVPDSTSYYWRFTSTGGGKFDGWDYGNTVYTGLPTTSTFPDMRNYKLPDTNETICSSFQCSPHVITVGNYWNHGTIIDYDTMIATNPNYVPCMLWAGSSRGPTRDGRTKPDVSAAGNNTLSTLPLAFRSAYIAGDPSVIDIGGYHIVDGGTSMASPEVAGVAGMLLEKYPLATNDNIKNMIIYCSDQDNCTGYNLPDNKWGFGKIDAFKAMTGCSLGLNGITNVPASTLSVYPNPTMDNALITYDFSSISDFCTAQLSVYDVMGKEVKTMELKNSKGDISFNKGDLMGGTYFYSLIVDGTRLKTEKLVIL